MTQNIKPQLLQRIRIIQGHLSAIQQMIEQDKYCVDIIHQSAAVQKALKRMDAMIIDSHLQHCVVDQIQHGQADKSVRELIRLFEMK